MVCRLVGAKPLSETMVGYCYFDPWEQTFSDINRNAYIFIQENVVCEMVAILFRPQCVTSCVDSAIEVHSFESRPNGPATWAGQMGRRIYTVLHGKTRLFHAAIYACSDPCGPTQFIPILPHVDQASKSPNSLM